MEVSTRAWFVWRPALVECDARLSLWERVDNMRCVRAMQHDFIGVFTHFELRAISKEVVAQANTFSE